MAEMSESQRDKEVAYYQALVAEWISSRNYYDRHIVTLSAAGVAYMVSNGDDIYSLTQAYLWILSILFFAICIWLGLRISRANADYIESIIAESESNKVQLQKLGSSLACKTKVLTLTFVAGVCLAALSLMYNSQAIVVIGRDFMSSDEEKRRNINSSDLEKRGLDGLQNLKPPKQNDKTKDAPESADSN